MAGKEKLLGVQYLRAIAALMVAYFHLTVQVPAFTATLSFPSSDNLSMGVGIFFVISGFIMYVTGRKLSAGEFARRRLIRILPLYWSLTIAVCVIATFAPHLLHRTAVSVEYLAKSLLFVPYHSPTQRGVFFPLLVPGWTLNYEMAFYGLFAVALFAPQRYRMWIVGSFLCVCVGAGVVRGAPILMSWWGFYTAYWLLLFALGIALGACYTSIVATRWACAALVLGGFVLILANLPQIGSWPTFQLVGATAIVIGAVCWERQYGLPRWRLLLLLGDASYSIYLVHLFAFGIIREVWKHVPLHGELSAIGFAITSLLFAVSLALATYQLIEKPALALLTRPKRAPLISDVTTISG